MIVESPFEGELQVVERSNYATIQYPYCACVLVDRVAKDETWPCWIGAASGEHLKEALKERFDSDPTWERAIVFCFRDNNEAATITIALWWMLASAPNPVMTDPLPRPVLPLEAVLRVLYHLAPCLLWTRFIVGIIQENCPRDYGNTTGIESTEVRISLQSLYKLRRQVLSASLLFSKSTP